MAENLFTKNFFVNFFIIVIIFFSTTIAFAQTPQTPDLCKVTVENDSVVKIFWHYDDTTTIDGFIIKRRIFDGIGVIDGTLNNIQLLPNTSLTYVDTSQSFDTQANPYIRSEEYSISAFVYRNDSTILSYMTMPQKTVFLQGQWIFCEQKAVLTWSKYINRSVKKYIVYISNDNANYLVFKELPASDTSFEITDLQTDKLYYFKVAAVLETDQNCNIDTSWSNTINFYAANLSNTAHATPLFASVESDKIHVAFNVEGTNIKKIELFKVVDNQDIKLAQSNSVKFFHYYDNTDVSTLNNYFVKITDVCDNETFTTAQIHNNVLNVTDKNNIFFLSWTGTTLDDALPDKYTVFAKFGNGWQEIDETQGSAKSLQIKYAKLFDNTQVAPDLQEVAFRVKAQNDTLSAWSNIVNVPISGLFAVPNVFNPNANDEQDRFFTVKAMFIKDFHLIIYTKNYEIIFQSDDLNNRWDGSINGTLCKQGAYIYYITYTSNSGKKDKISGIVNLIY